MINRDAFYPCDPDLDPTNLIYELDLHVDIPKLYLLTKNTLSRSRLSKVSSKAFSRVVIFWVVHGTSACTSPVKLHRVQKKVIYFVV